MVFVVAVVVGLIFGGGDQYLGSINATALWTISLSMLSAAWLLLPFGFGCSQLRARRAAAVGLVATTSALAGYFLMIVGPLEGGQWTMNLREIHGLLFSNAPNIIGGLITGPLYGVLGQRWRTRRAWVSAVLVAGALCLEPLALTLVGRSYPGDSVVWPSEVGVGIVVAICFIATGVAFRRHVESGLGKNAAV
jgi:hypothetical protein